MQARTTLEFGYFLCAFWPIWVLFGRDLGVRISGLNYKLIISLPHSYNHPEASRESYPVVYALDAEPYLFPLLAVVARTEHFFKRSTWFPDLIIVGITADLEKDAPKMDPTGPPVVGGRQRIGFLCFFRSLCLIFLRGDPVMCFCCFKAQLLQPEKTTVWRRVN